MMSSKDSAARRGDNGLALGVFVLALVIYLRTLCPTVYWGDCGELATAAYTLGIAHPTGYPLWTMLGKVWTLVFPFGTIIWRLNVLSAVYGALGVAALFGFARAVGLSRSLSVLVAGLFAFSRTFWQQCLFAETYSLTACLTCLLLFLAARWRARGRQDGDLRWLAFGAGLAMCNGQMNTLFLPGAFLFVLWSEPTLRAVRETPTRKRWAATLGVGLLPLLCYAYLPIRARMQPAQNWGDPETPWAFYYHVTARPYTGLMFHLSRHEVLHNLHRWAVGLGNEYVWPLVALALVGLARLWMRRNERPLAAMLTWTLAVNVFYTINYAIYNQYIYFIAGYVVLAAGAGFGLDALWPWVEGKVEEAKRPQMRRLAAACLPALVAFQIVGHWGESDLSRNWTCVDYGRNLLATLAPGSLLIDSGSDTSKGAMTYLQKVEGVRPDVTLVNRGMMDSLYDYRYKRWANRWYFEQLVRHYPDAATLYPDHPMTPADVFGEDLTRRLMAQGVLTGRPVFIHLPPDPQPFEDTKGRQTPLVPYLTRCYDVTQVGLLTRLYPHGKRPSNAALLVETDRLWRSYTLRGVYGSMYLSDDYLTPIAFDYAQGGLTRARLAEAQGDYAQAEDAYRQVLTLFKSDEAFSGLARCAQARQVASK